MALGESQAVGRFFLMSFNKYLSAANLYLPGLMLSKGPSAKMKILAFIPIPEWGLLGREGVALSEGSLEGG